MICHVPLQKWEKLNNQIEYLRNILLFSFCRVTYSNQIERTMCNKVKPQELFSNYHSNTKANIPISAPRYSTQSITIDEEILEQLAVSGWRHDIVILELYSHWVNCLVNFCNRPEISLCLIDIVYCSWDGCL